MATLSSWLGDIHQIEGLGREVAGAITVLISAFCGTLIGIERERRDKPAGLRTVILICVGATIYTMISLLLASHKPTSDPARLAAQIIPGIGFLGAGAIIHGRGTVTGMTTGATIWAVAAVGVTVGAGYLAAGLFFTLVLLAVLTGARQVATVMLGRCRRRTHTVVFSSARGKTWPRVQAVLDRFQIHDTDLVRRTEPGHEHEVDIPVCMVHRDHRAVLQELAEIDAVLELRAG